MNRITKGLVIAAAVAAIGGVGLAARAQPAGLGSGSQGYGSPGYGPMGAGPMGAMHGQGGSGMMGGRGGGSVTDPAGHLLWVEGDRTTRRLAERISLVPGALWSESAAGTNAMGTSLAVDHAVQVFSAEHVRASLHGWTCAAAPLHAARTGTLMGCVDLTGPANTVHPHSLALVSAAAVAVGHHGTWAVRANELQEAATRLAEAARVC